MEGSGKARELNGPLKTGSLISACLGTSSDLATHKMWAWGWGCGSGVQHLPNQAVQDLGSTPSVAKTKTKTCAKWPGW